MSSPELLAFAAKMATSAAVVVLASRLVERAGPVVGALVATLPLSAGPAYAFLGAEHGAAFVAASALASLPAVAATAAFVTTYVILAQRRGLAASLAGALGCWAVAAWAGGGAASTLPGALGLGVAAYAVAFVLVRPYRHAGPTGRASGRPWEVLVRTVAVMAVVGAALLVGRAAGPTAAGIVSLAPVVFTGLVLVLHPRLGGRATAAVLANTLPGMLGYLVGREQRGSPEDSWGFRPAQVFAFARARSGAGENLANSWPC
jgi:uncharacterized membrane protein (GlpM family)